MKPSDFIERGHLPLNPSRRYQEELPAFDRVRSSTPEYVNRRIDQDAQEHLLQLEGDTEEVIIARLLKLEREWDVDRALMANFAILGGAIFLAGVRMNPRWFAVLPLQMSFLLYHSLRGWCPTVSVLRKLGFRTVREIDAEKAALEQLLRERSRQRH